MILLVLDAELIPVARAIVPPGTQFVSEVGEGPAAYGLGYAESADRIAQMLLNQPALLAGAVLLRPTQIQPPDTLPDLTGIPILAVPSRHGSHAVPQLLARAGAAVDLAVQDADEFLVPQDFALVKRWLAQFA